MNTPQSAAEVPAPQSLGCAGGRMEFVEVDDARCADGKENDLEFDGAFKLLEKSWMTKRSVTSYVADALGSAGGSAN